jgi:hypothetical protein
VVFEAPSNYLAFRLEMKALRRNPALNVTVKSVAKPDPRESIGTQKYLLWEYTGTDAIPGLSPPGDDIALRIGKPASLPYDDQANWAAASHVAERIGQERMPEILAVMIHPPAMPADEHALSWLPRVQLAAAQVIGQMGEDWRGSARRDALFSVLLGPGDWATNAAIRVLARLGREHEPIAPDIHEAFQQLRSHRPNDGYCCWEHTLFRHWLELPCLFPRERKELQEALRKIEKPPK